MDAYFPVKFIVLGFTGLIGSEIYSQLTNQRHKVIGINSTVVKSDNKILVQRSKPLAEEVRGFLEIGDVVINTAWVGSDRNNRNDLVHAVMANYEIELINLLQEMQIRYMSLGSISEIKVNEITDSWNSQYAESKRSVFKYLSESMNQVVQNFLYTHTNLI